MTPKRAILAILVTLAVVLGAGLAAIGQAPAANQAGRSRPSRRIRRGRRRCRTTG
jgi:hypothetical protein